MEYQTSVKEFLFWDYAKNMEDITDNGCYDFCRADGFFTVSGSEN